MRLLGIIPDKVFHQLLIEDFHFIQFIYMPVNKLLLNSSVKPFQVAVRLWMLGVIEEVYETSFLASLSKVFFEFTTIVSLDPGSDKWGNISELLKEILAIGRRVGFIGIGEGKSRPDVNSGKDIAFDASSKDRDGIHLNKVARLLGHEAFSPSFLPGRFPFSYQ